MVERSGPSMWPDACSSSHNRSALSSWWTTWSKATMAASTSPSTTTPRFCTSSRWQKTRSLSAPLHCQLPPAASLFPTRLINPYMRMLSNLSSMCMGCVFTGSQASIPARRRSAAADLTISQPRGSGTFLQSSSLRFPSHPLRVV